MITECKACGYEHGIKWEGIDGRTEIGDERFVNIKGSFHIEKEYNYGGTFSSEVRLIACPKCKTVMLDD